MFSQNQDMDDLFRKAAARYPLKPGNNDWERIVARLQPINTSTEDDNDYRRGKYYVLLLLLMPIAFLFHNTQSGKADSTSASRSTTKLASRSSEIASLYKGKPTGVRFQINKTYSSLFSNKDFQGPEVMEKDIAASFPELTALPNEQKSITLIPTMTELKAQAITLQKHPGLIKHFYFGPVAGLDFGMVKSQGFTDPGYNVGILAGFRFNRRLSFESGVSWIQKKYFTQGAHFSMKKLESSMPSGMEMEAVEGRFSLFEIPYKIKYDLPLKGKSDFFISAGGSTNIYVKESNEYLTRLNGVRELHNASYSDVHCSPLCLVHVTAGYEHSLGKRGRIRLEPYAKIPLRKVGMGSVPVFSIGLNVAIYQFR